MRQAGSFEFDQTALITIWPFALRSPPQRQWILSYARIINPHQVHCTPYCGTTSMARVYADVNQHMPKSYWEYDSVNITWGVLENYEVVRKIGRGFIYELAQ